jgi:hypothetical protein
MRLDKARRRRAHGVEMSEPRELPAAELHVSRVMKKNVGEPPSKSKQNESDLKFSPAGP